MNIAVIPARGGSKRIPHKNVRPFAGVPLLAHSIRLAAESRLFAHIVVSTDDAAIQAVALEHGAETPFVRPAHLSDDHASTDAVLVHAIEQCTALYGEIDYACCIYPAAPFARTAQLHEGLALLQQHRAVSSFPVVRYDFPIEQSFLLECAKLRPRFPDKLDDRSQDLPVSYHDAGMFYWCDVPRFAASPRLMGDDAVAFPVPAEFCQDINSEEDWTRAELKYRLLHGRQT